MNTSSSSSAIPVSTVLLTKNAVKHLPRYLDSMREIDDIIVLNGGSTDGTVELLKNQPNCRVFVQPKEFLDAQGFITDFSGVRNYGYSLAKHRWILCVDADEAASPELLKEVREIAMSGKPGVYYVQRLFTLDGKPILTFGATDHVRLFHLDCVRGCVKPVHERLDILPGSFIGHLSEVVVVPVHSAKKMRPKYDRYLEIEAMHVKGMPFSRWFRWFFIRNLISIARRFVIIIVIRLIPKSGPRYPLSLEWEQIRYQWLLIWKTLPSHFKPI